MKSNDEESSLPEILQRIPGGHSARNGVCPMLRGTDGTQMNMASEQRTELWKCLADRRRMSAARLRRDRPLQRRSADQAPAEVFSVRKRRREVVTR